MIEVKNIFKTFDDNQVLKDISAQFEKGKANLIIGQSGSGKTVMMKCCIGLIEPDEGEIRFDGRPFSRLNEKDKKDIRKEMGVLFQGGALFDSFTVEQNVMFPLNMFTDMSPEEKLDRVNFCLKRVNLENVNKLLPAEISGGMMKRVAIARAISNKPQYLFCDEPNSGLDPKTAEVIDALIKEITEEYQITTVINTHDMNSVLQIGQRINFLYKGELWWQGDRHTILDTDNPELRDFVFSTELTRRIK
ncbi:MAG: ATP-binding cassette domain-containing protein [Bacteroidetes bacterium]|jgi:phospholipid/cholesterol/gamma-HCH transport system ATP-binding protein|nr:ATP-binding cassette domain-containing protein [Bacteroidota bacterium]MBU1577970.1 ATP-binding cassette domain-containing protein [Bacteroidota bacterium]MBU2466284.1 ATP-binding cassette domain-containing protein [Bacteroidota bacterium]MDA3942238.1 ATP-binding cassette domain-containing protein [Bacteroidota bacterium]